MNWRPSGSYCFWLAAVPLVCGTVATTLYFAQGGFGAGHGHLDLFIGILALPAVLVLERIPNPDFMKHSDLLLVIWYPAFLNLLLFWGPIACVAYAVGRLGKRPPR